MDVKESECESVQEPTGLSNESAQPPPHKRVVTHTAQSTQRKPKPPVLCLPSEAIAVTQHALPSFHGWFRWSRHINAIHHNQYLLHIPVNTRHLNQYLLHIPVNARHHNHESRSGTRSLLKPLSLAASPPRRLRHLAPC
ncbi:unnamed protein product [Arctogadus glacialis]